MKSAELSHRSHTARESERKSDHRRLVRPEFRASGYRRQFLESIQGLVPEAIQDLVGNAGRGAPAIQAWCRRWHLVDGHGAAADWMVKAAEMDLAFRCHDPSTSYSPLEWACSPWVFPEAAGGIAIPERLKHFQPPEYGGMSVAVYTCESIAEMKKGILKDVERRLDAHIQAFEGWAGDPALIEEPVERHLSEHFRWFVRFQMKGEPYKAIADEAAVRKAVRRIAEVVGLALRQEKRGRKPKS